MLRHRFLFLTLLGSLIACGGSESTSPPPPTSDATTDSAADASIDGADSGRTDAPADSIVDAPPNDGPCACKPSWCGCGTCATTDIVCSVTPHECPLGCAGSCPEQATTVCDCVADRCVRKGIAGSIACYADADCPPGNCCSKSGPSGPGARGVCRADGDPCCGAGCP